MIYLLIFINSHRHDLKSNTFNRPDKFQRHIKTLLSARKIRLMQFYPLHHHGICAEPSHWTFDFSTHDHHIKASRILTAALSTGFQWKFPVLWSFMKYKLVYHQLSWFTFLKLLCMVCANGKGNSNFLKETSPLLTTSGSQVVLLFLRYCSFKMIQRNCIL